MASDTYKKRQKEMARKEKKQKKFARRMERKHEKTRTENGVEEENPTLVQPDARQGPPIS